jgi:GWxTD domain-containing protein
LLKFPSEASQKIVLARVTVADSKKSSQLLFHKQLPSNSALFGKTGNRPITRSYINHQQPVSFSGFQGSSTLSVSYYENAFPPAAPAYSTAQARVTKTLKPDSLFQLDGNATVTLYREGLYLVQQDTASSQGVAFRLEDDYPRLGKLESLAGPLIYISTKAEYDKLRAAGSDKKKFDQVILSITGNAERARIFMRSYFRRVESANQYFSSYKEGWKTDRGMIYIIYGTPDEVYLFDDREVWEYKNENLRERFQFVKSATIFDPENFVLIRSKGFTNDWYNMIDLWRKARF